LVGYQFPLATDAVKRLAASVMQDAESFAVGAKPGIDMQFWENAGVRIPFNLTDAAGRCRHGAKDRVIP
jgi:histidinol phosphatase-like enzyme